MMLLYLSSIIFLLTAANSCILLQHIIVLNISIIKLTVLQVLRVFFFFIFSNNMIIFLLSLYYFHLLYDIAYFTTEICFGLMELQPQLYTKTVNTKYP